MADRVDATIARRVAVEAAPAGRPGNATEAALVNYLRPRATTDPEQALKVMSIRDIPPRQVASVFIDQQIGPSDQPVDRNSGLKFRNPNVGGNSTPFEVTLANEAQRSLDNVYNFLERGTISPPLRAEVLRLLYTDDRFRSIMGETLGAGNVGVDALNRNLPLYMANPNLIPPGIRNMIDSVVRGEGFNSKLRELLKQRIDLTKKNEDPAIELRSRLNGFVQELNIIQAELNPANPNSLAAQLATIDNQLLAYRSPVGGPIGARASDINTWRGNMGVLQSTVSALTAQNNADNAQAARYISMGNNAQANALYLAIQGREPQITAAQGQIETIKADLKTYEEEQKELNQQRQRTQTEISSREKRRNELAVLIATEQSKVQPLENDRAVREREFAGSITGIFADAAGEYLTERIQTIDQRYTALMEQRQKTAGDEITRSVDELLKQRYFDFARNTLRPSMERYRAGGSFWFDEVRPVNMQRIEQDMATYRRGGPYAIVNAWVGDQIRAQVREQSNIPPGTALNADQQREVRRRIDEVSASKSNDMILDMLVTRRRMGANLSLEDVRIIQRNNPGIIKTVLERDATLRDEIVQLAGEGAITNISRLPDGLILKVLGGAVTALGLGVRATIGTERPY